MSDYIQDGTGAGYRAKVDTSNRLQVSAISISAESQSASDGGSFNISNDIVEITSDAEVALVYANNSNSEDWVVSRVYFHFGGSTGGVGSGEFCMITNATTGTLIDSGTALLPVNGNLGSSKSLIGTFLQGATGSTVTSGTEFLRTLVPAFTGRNIIPLDNVVLPPGTSLTLSFKPPVGNTSLKVQLGMNLFRRDL